jgi:hypothetical protein
VSREKVNSGIGSVYIEFGAIVHSVTDRFNPKCGYNLFTNPYWNTDEKHGHDTRRFMWVLNGRPRCMRFISVVQTRKSG